MKELLDEGQTEDPCNNGDNTIFESEDRQTLEQLMELTVKIISATKESKINSFNNNEGKLNFEEICMSAPSLPTFDEYVRSVRPCVSNAFVILINMSLRFVCLSALQFRVAAGPGDGSL